MRKIGSRRVVVDGTAYRWRIRHRATGFQADYGNGILHISIELAEQPGAVLVLLTGRPHPADWGGKMLIPVTPSDIAIWVRQAIEAGWSPERPGPQVALRVGGASVTPIANWKTPIAPRALGASEAAAAHLVHSLSGGPSAARPAVEVPTVVETW